MNIKLFSAAAIAASALLPLAAQAQTIIAQDNASSAAYVNAAGDNSSYSQGQNGGSGFGAFNVASNGAAGTFEYSSTQSEDGSANINSPIANSNNSPLSFGLFAQGGGKDATGNTIPLGTSVTVTRGFNTALASGGTFALDFVTGYNDGPNGGGQSGVALTGANGTVGSFLYQSGNVYLFNGAAITGQNFTTGALHLVYDITSPTSYSFTSTGAVNFSGTGTFSSPITGFQVMQKDSGVADPNHNAYFNNLVETASPAAVPEASSFVGFGLLLTLGGLAIIARKRTVKA